MLARLLSYLGIEVQSMTYEEALGVLLCHHIDQIASEWHEDPDLLHHDEVGRHCTSERRCAEGANPQ